MSLETYALSTVADVKDFLGLGATAEPDESLFESLINNVSVLFANYCGVEQFKTKNYIEYHDGHGSRYIFPRNYPINSVDEINEDIDWVWGSDTTIGEDDYRIVDKRYIVYDGLFAIAEQSIKIEYSAGYDTIPLDLKQACIEEVVRKYKHRKDLDVSSKSAQDGTTNYIVKDLLPSTKITLDRYKKLRVEA
jgi:hypothetical protein